MKITLTSIAPRRSRSKAEATDRLLADYIERATRYLPCDSQLFDSEPALLDWLDRQPGRTPAYAILLDSRGQQLSSDEFAQRLGTLRDAWSLPSALPTAGPPRLASAPTFFSPSAASPSPTNSPASSWPSSFTVR